MQYSYLVIDEDSACVQDILRKMEDFPEYFCVGTAATKEEGINKILETRPGLVFLDIAPKSKKSNLSLQVVTELYQYIDVLPKFVALTTTPKYAFDAIGAGMFDYILKPLNVFDLRKTLLKFAKSNPVEANTTICIKSYGDYQFVSLSDIVYLKADNNTTDFILQNGRKLTAYKTLKHYEVNLPFFFFRIHNSYIVNSNHVSRINSGKSLVYLNGGETSISYSKTFKDNIDALIRRIAPEYL